MDQGTPVLLYAVLGVSGLAVILLGMVVVILLSRGGGGRAARRTRRRRARATARGTCVDLEWFRDHPHTFNRVPGRDRDQTIADRRDRRSHPQASPLDRHTGAAPRSSGDRPPTQGRDGLSSRTSSAGGRSRRGAAS